MPIDNQPQHCKLPDDRAAVTHKFRVGDVKVYLTVGFYPDGRVGEIFLAADRVGSMTRHAFSALAIMMSMALQHGVPLKTLTGKLVGIRGDPSGFTGNPRLPMAHSIADYVGRWLEMRFPKERTDDPSSSGAMVDSDAAAASGHMVGDGNQNEIC